MCSVSFIKAKEATLQAEHEAAVFHERLESAQYDAIWDTATPAFQASIQPSPFSRYLGGIHDKMGPCGAPSKPITYSSNANTSGTTVRLQYRIECSNGPLDEVFTFAKNGTVMALLGYRASSPFLPK